jgi:hypothetical protein
MICHNTWICPKYKTTIKTVSIQSIYPAESGGNSLFCYSGLLILPFIMPVQTDIPSIPSGSSTSISPA